MNNISRIEIISRRDINEDHLIYDQFFSTAARFPLLKPRTRLWPDYFNDWFWYCYWCWYHYNIYLYVFLNSH